MRAPGRRGSSERDEHLGHRDGAVLALAVLHEGDDRAADGDGGAVQRCRTPGRPPSGRMRTSSRRAWKSVVFEHDVSSR